MYLTQWLKSGKVATKPPVAPGLADPADATSSKSTHDAGLLVLKHERMTFRLIFCADLNSRNGHTRNTRKLDQRENK